MSLVENILKVVGCEDEELMSANANKDATVFSTQKKKNLQRFCNFSNMPF